MRLHCGACIVQQHISLYRAFSLLRNQSPFSYYKALRPFLYTKASKTSTIFPGYQNLLSSYRGIIDLFTLFSIIIIRHQSPIFSSFPFFTGPEADWPRPPWIISPPQAQTAQPQVIPPPLPHQAHSPNKRPSQILGAFAAGAGYLVADAIQNKFRSGWTVHIPLTFLTDKYCTYKKSTALFHDSPSVDEASGQIITASKTLSDIGELNLTFEEWHQAWRRLLPLIREFLPDNYNAWNTHFLTI